MEHEIKDRCSTCNAPMVYDGKYDCYKCSAYKLHDAIDRKEWERKWGIHDQKDAVTPSGNDEKRRRKR